ncbi:phage tail protein [Enterobacteriaceae bacterium YMB-R22]|uniref:phage tail-collar fiber domain-containing protein n=1 Tax=Tenebrionicola larvae TaxID=2815733 RepID=UPI002010EBD9|nr:phage tail protein [Tenebrionicola larvae]MBV4412892.1 phage tail protein [Tenebrionicola larvae]
MTAKYFAILTSQGAARLANAAALGTKLNLTQMAVGDANGTLPTPDPAQTTLINQRRIAPLNLLTVDPANTSQIIAEQIIPENEGGFWIREIGLYDDDGVLIAVANCPETYKPQLQEGSGRTQTIRMVLIVSSTSAITLKIDPSVVLATRQYVDDAIAGSLPAGIPQPWPLAVPPDGWLKCNGAAFDKTKYPKLATAYPSGNLPDLRGEFVRGWDDGRGVDVGREILGPQADAIENVIARFYLRTASNNVSVPGWGGPGFAVENVADLETNPFSVLTSAPAYKTRVTLNTSGVVKTAAETRPRNIAFNYIVRAA